MNTRRIKKLTLAPRMSRAALSEDEIDTLCDKLAERLEDWNLIGMVILLMSHVVWSEIPEDAMFTVRKYLIYHNAHGRDQAVDFLEASALTAIRTGKGKPA